MDSLCENPELLQRFSKVNRALPLCILASPVSQVAQTIKAAAGIVLPSIYYRNDELIESFAALHALGIELGVSNELLDALQRGRSSTLWPCIVKYTVDYFNFVSAPVMLAQRDAS
jgi:hypothetical protein